MLRCGSNKLSLDALRLPLPLSLLKSLFLPLTLEELGSCFLDRALRLNVAYSSGRAYECKEGPDWEGKVRTRSVDPLVWSWTGSWLDFLGGSCGESAAVSDPKNTGAFFGQKYIEDTERGLISTLK